MKISKLFQSALSLGAICILTSCAVGPKLGSDGSYASPDGMFTCRVPESLLDPSVDAQKGDATMVAIVDDLGRLYRVDCYPRIPPAYSRQSKERGLNAIFSDVMMPPILAAAPSAKVVTKEYLEGFRNGALHVALKAPDISILAVKDSLLAPPHREPATREMLLFYVGDSLVWVSHQEGHLFGPRAKGGASKAFSNLMKFAASVQLQQRTH